MVNSNSSSAQHSVSTQWLRGKLLPSLCCAFALVLILAACGTGGNDQGGNAQTSTSSETTYPTVGRISCDHGEHSDYHIRVHLTMYINGNQKTIPGQIGIAPDGSCSYWLHTNDDSGVIHVEAPASVGVTLSDFLEIWEQKFPDLGFPQELTQSGWNEYLNGQAVNDISTIPLHEHDLFTFMYNSPAASPDTSYNWPVGL